MDTSLAENSRKTAATSPLGPKVFDQDGGNWREFPPMGQAYKLIRERMLPYY